MFSRLQLGRAARAIALRVPAPATAAARLSFPHEILFRSFMPSVSLSTRMLSSSTRMLEQYSRERVHAPSESLYVGNIPYDASEADVAVYFENLPGFEEMESVLDAQGRSRGYAKVKFASVEDCTAALESLAQSNPEVLGRSLRLRYLTPENRRPEGKPSQVLFVGGLPADTTEADLRAVFIGFEIDNINLQQPRIEGKRAYAWVTFISTEQATAAVEANFEKPIWPGGPTMRLDYANSERNSSPAQSKYAPNETLFVGGLGDRDIRALEELFKGFGPKNARIINDRMSGQSRGFGYVEFDSIEIATKALNELNGVTTGGRTLRVDFAPPRDASREAPQRRFGSKKVYGGGGRGAYGGGY